MSFVARGVCPDCGRDTGPAGTVVYSFEPRKRVVACPCGSVRVPLVAASPEHGA